VSAVTDLPVVPGSTIGIVANPMSGRDIRRLVAQASVFPNAEKTNMVLRLLAAAGAAGVERALVSTDGMGVAGGVARGLSKRRRSEGRLPRLEFVELGALTGTADDTRALVRAMRARGAAVIVVLGGDGTVRAAAAEIGDTPLLPLSTGTNNAFPEMWEATVAGTAAGLVATERMAADEVTHRSKALHVTAGDTHEIALVDVCVTTVAHVAAKALWPPETLRELSCTFAVDGGREIEFGPATPVTVTLAHDGPRVLDVRAALAAAAAERLLVRENTLQSAR
jgi:predicted polyphosphate/ATP-dependent NAD kinase